MKPSAWQVFGLVNSMVCGWVVSGEGKNNIIVIIIITGNNK